MKSVTPAILFYSQNKNYFISMEEKNVRWPVKIVHTYTC